MKVEYKEVKMMLLKEINDAPSEHWAVSLTYFLKKLNKKYGEEERSEELKNCKRYYEQEQKCSCETVYATDSNTVAQKNIYQGRD